MTNTRKQELINSFITSVGNTTDIMVDDEMIDEIERVLAKKQLAKRLAEREKEIARIAYRKLLDFQLAEAMPLITKYADRVEEWNEGVKIIFWEKNENLKSVTITKVNNYGWDYEMEYNTSIFMGLQISFNGGATLYTHRTPQIQSIKLALFEFIKKNIPA